MLLLQIFWGLNLFAQAFDPFAIYGKDSRIEVADAPAIAQELSVSVAAFIKPKMYRDRQDGGMLLVGEGYGSANQLCSSERFYDQTAYAYCSGVLVAPNVVLTAAHCIGGAESCENIRITFDLQDEGSWRSPEPKEVMAADTYRCHRILAREKKYGIDFTLIELDRKSDRPVIPIVQPDDFSSVFVIGHPMGLTQKYATGELIKDKKYEYVTTLDTYMGNSGSPVFSQKGQFVGILTAGAEDFVKSVHGCMLSKRCTQKTCEGESVFKAFDAMLSQYF